MLPALLAPLSQDVAMFRGNLAHTGVYDAAGAPGLSGVKWRFKNGGERRFAATHLHGSLPTAECMSDPFDCYLSSPAVWNGNVYFGSGDGNVYALDAGTGSVKWKFHTGGVVHASPAISGGVVFIGVAATSTPSTPPAEKRSGVSRPGWILTSTTR